MKPEELIEQYEFSLNDHPVFATIDGTQEIIDCLKGLVARAEKAEKALKDIRDAFPSVPDEEKKISRLWPWQRRDYVVQKTIKLLYAIQHTLDKYYGTKT